MNLPLNLSRWLHAARRRSVLIALALWLAPALALTAVAAGLGGPVPAVSMAVVALLVLAIGLHRRLQGLDASWLARRLDERCPELEDSSALLWQGMDGALAALQRARLARRLNDRGELDLRPDWPLPALGLSLLLALAILAMGYGLHRWSEGHASAVPDTVAPAAPRQTRLTEVALRVEPPAYTGLPAREESVLDTKVAEGARVAWRLRFEPQPEAAALVFHDGSRLALVRDGREWSGSRVLTQAALYRLELSGGPRADDQRLHRLDLIPDRAPEVQVTQPEKTLSLLDAGQKTWALAFEASDDYGLGEARLTITLAQGSGENITFKEQSLVLNGEGDERHRQYRHSLDLNALGIAQGDDVIVRLAVSDRREPKPNTTRSASFILRWPPEASTDSAGMDGVVRKTLPAYFRSQRQIIIDTEALLAQKPELAEDKFAARSDELGVEQKVLRLRYGQFLGEEFESGHEGAEPEHDEHHDDHHGDDGKAAKDKDASARGAKENALAGAPEHEHSDKPAAFGSAGDVLAEFGHTHDHAEAATLLDPETKAILKSALNEMWQAELHLRSAAPDQALPYEYKALEYIKQVQQSTRIYLARVGLELPPVDETRRLSGDRTGLRDRTSALAAATSEDVVVPGLWQALESGVTPDWDGFEAWVRHNEKRLPDALGLLAGADALRRDANCSECKSRLEVLLWPLLPTPAAGIAPRAAPDAEGRAYLDALKENQS